MSAAIPTLPEPGALVDGKYKVLRLLGEGGMGAVYEAVHEVTKKRFAIKWMSPALAQNEQAMARFTQEARTSCAIEHPNIVDVFDVADDNGAMYLVMELLRGEALSDRIARGEMPPMEVASTLLPVLHGLHEAHGKGIVHRDLKPDNIFLSQQRPGLPVVAKVLDFGISKMGRDGAESAMRLTATGTMMGTAAYMAPEQTMDAAGVDARADVYSFGVILYEALSGRLPFSSSSFARLVVMISSQPPPDIREVFPDVHSGLANVVMRTLAKDPADRPQSAQMLAREICEALDLPLETFSPSGADRDSFSSFPSAPSLPSATPSPYAHTTPASSLGEAAPPVSDGPTAKKSRAPILWVSVMLILSIAAGAWFGLVNTSDSDMANDMPATEAAAVEAAAVEAAAVEAAAVEAAAVEAAAVEAAAVEAAAVEAAAAEAAAVEAAAEAAAANLPDPSVDADVEARGDRSSRMRRRGSMDRETEMAAGAVMTRLGQGSSELEAF